MDNEALLELVRNGLCEECKPISDERFAISDSDVLRLAVEQSAVGLVTDGVGKLLSGILPLAEKLTLLGKCQLIEFVMWRRSTLLPIWCKGCEMLTLRWCW